MPDPVTRLNAALEGRYRIESELGEGGMATVYLAEDLRHKRNVALKVLKPELAAVVGAERFLAEIETTAGLQHPHILPLFDSGEADGFLFYVMPFVEGESLRDRLDREKQLPVDEAVRIATDLAEALDYAHRRSVIHRDIKPANILLSEGRPLVADFGIALAVAQAGGGRLTETGLSMGTPYYMSPEQASADRDPSPASDVYSLGCVLYEMLVGEPPYMGGSAQAVLARILTEDARAPTTVRASIPANVDAAIRKALEKLPADRFAGAHDFATALADRAFRHGDSLDGTSATSASQPWQRIAFVTSAVAVAALAFSFWSLGRQGVGIRDVGLQFDAPMQLGFTRNFDVSRDGSFIVYRAAQDSSTILFYRSLVTEESRVIQGTEGAGATPRVSPDGVRVAFQANGQVKIVPIAGGPVSTVAEAQDPFGDWLDDGFIFYSDEDGRVLKWIDPVTGPVNELQVSYCINPELIDREQVLCGGGGNNSGHIRYLSDPDEEHHFRRETVQEGVFSGLAGSHFRLIDGEYVVYMAPSGDLRAAPLLDRDSLIIGRAVTLVSGVRTEAYSGSGQYDITDDGTLVYVPGINAEVGRLVSISEDGQETLLPIESAAHVRFDFSPDGRSLASVVEGIQNHELRIYDLATGRVQTIDEDYYIGQPRWSPDGQALVYQKSPDVGVGALYHVQPNSTNGPAKLLDGARNTYMLPSSYLSDTELLIGSGSARSAMVVDPTVTPPQVDSLGLSVLFVSLSPDERWLAYQNQGAVGVFVEPWPARSERFAIDPLAVDPQWRSSTELIYYTARDRDGGTFHRVSIDASANPPVGATAVWKIDPLFADTDGPSFALSPDGNLVYRRSMDQNRGYYVRVVPAWVERMKRAVDEANR